jgi:ubiquinone/menaquinone biosynthesis C-methylase UbiE
METSTLKKEQSFNDWVRDFYNSDKQVSAKGNYEHFRWFSTPKKRRQHEQTTQSLTFHLQDIQFKNCLDIGCGPGTWTFLLLDKYKEANFTCLDISKEMLAQFQSRVNNPKINFIVSSFSDFQVQEKYDFIFCSRSIDYMEDKPAVIQKMFDSLDSKGKGIIVTSPPHPTLAKIKQLAGKKINQQHTQRIPVDEMKSLLDKTGFTNIQFFPILFADKLPEALNKSLFNNNYKKPWNTTSKLFASGYLVKFEKP